MEKNIKPQIWSPLAGGKIFDMSWIDPTVIRIREVFQNLSVQYNTTIECLILV
jgi:predicted oxidoreductase